MRLKAKSLTETCRREKTVSKSTTTIDIVAFRNAILFVLPWLVGNDGQGFREGVEFQNVYTPLMEKLTISVGRY